MLVLIVEDDPLIGMDLREELISAGYEVVGPATDDREAIALAEQRPPEVALIDIDLCGDNEGVAVARRLHGELGVATVFVSGERDTAMANQDAAIGYLPKPYTHHDAISTIEVAAEVGRGGAVPPPMVPRAMKLFRH